MEALQRRKEAAIAAVSEAATLALRHRPPPGAPVASLKAAQDWVTETDRAVEALLARRLADAFPEDGFMGEETGTGRTGALRWIADPVDGTSNFARGGTRWCVSLGLLDGDRPILGVIAAPALAETLVGGPDIPPTLNGRGVAAATTMSLERATVECGWSPRLPNDGYYRIVQRVMDAGAMLRAGGSGALGLADVACGRLDAYVERHINLWDVAAALAILAGSGAMVSDFMGGAGPAFGAPILAAAPGIGEQLKLIVDFTDLSSTERL